MLCRVLFSRAQFFISYDWFPVCLLVSVTILADILISVWELCSGLCSCKACFWNSIAESAFMAMKRNKSKRNTRVLLSLSVAEWVCDLFMMISFEGAK